MRQEILYMITETTMPARIDINDIPTALRLMWLELDANTANLTDKELCYAALNVVSSTV